MQTKVEEGDDSPEMVQGACHVGSAEHIENRLGPIGVVKLQGHAGDDQQQKTGHYQEMQEAVKRMKPGEPFLAFLGLDFGFPEFFRIMQVKPAGAEQPQPGMCAKKRENAHQQSGHEKEDPVQFRVVGAIQGIGVGEEFGETGVGLGMTLLASGDDVAGGEP